MIGTSIGGGINSVINYSNQFIFSAIKELSSNTGGSIAGRNAVAKGRRALIAKRPLLGYGFIDKDSSFGLKARKHIVGDLLGFVDNGILDISIKFGYFGIFVILISVFTIIVKLIKSVKVLDDSILRVRCLSVLSILIVFIVVLPVHSPFTYSYSLLPLGIALGLIARELKLVRSLAEHRDNI